MGEILVYWIEKKLGLEFPFFQDPQKFRRSVANGYLIGEILRKFNVISDDQCISLKKSLSNRNCVKNMQHLHKWLRDSGMDIDFQELLAIVEEEPGAAMRFIYRLYLWLECPKCFAAAGFRPLPNLRKHLRDSRNETTLRASMPFEEPQIIELKPWEGLLERHRKFSTDAENIHFVSESRANIYYDVPLQPPVLLNVRPYGGRGEDEPEDLYFDFKPPKPKRNKAGFLEDWKREIPTMLCAFRISPNTMKEKRRAMMSIAKAQEMEESFEEMGQFSDMMKTNLDRPQMEFKVYASGSGNMTDYKKTLLIMKQKRQEELALESERNNYRKNLTCKIQSSIPCDLNIAFDEEALVRVGSTLPSREKSLAEYVTSVHANKQCLIDHVFYEQNQLAEFRGYDLDKEESITQQRSSLRRLLEVRNQELRDSVTFKTLVVQEEVMYERNRKIIGEIITNLLDLVIKVATYREATGLCLDQSADILPPEQLMNEWIIAFHMADKAMEENPVQEGQELTILDNYHVDEYLFHAGDWAVDIPEGSMSPFIENYVLKKIVSYVLETVYPPPVPEAILPPPDIAGAAVLAGVNFSWKPVIVRELMLDVMGDFRLQVLDTSIIVQEAIKAYSTAVVKLEESKRLSLLARNTYAYGEDEEEGEFQTIWNLPQGPAGDYTDEDEYYKSAERARDRKSSDKDPDSKRGSDKRKGSERLSNAEAGKKRKSSVIATPTKSRSRKNVKTKNKAVAKNDDEDELESPSEAEVLVQIKSKGASEGSLTDQAGYGPNDITGRSFEQALKKKKRRDSRRRSSILDKKQSEWNNENSLTYEIVKDTLAEPLRVDVATEDDIQILFGPDDAPETWPEFVRLGKLALDQLLSGRSMADDVIAKIIVERMRHYPRESFVMILNYPHALCQAVTMEKAVRPNSLDKPPCYHHADMLIQQFKHLRGAEGDAVLSLALTSPLNPMKHRSALFQYGLEDNPSTAAIPTDEPFRSFIDAFIVADVHASDKLKTQTIMNALEEAREKMMAVPDRTIEERINVLLHISFLQMKKFYLDQGLAQVLDLGVDSESYYPAMRAYMELALADKREHLAAEELAMKTLMKRELEGEVSEEEEEMEEQIRLSIVPVPALEAQPAEASRVSETRDPGDVSLGEEGSKKGKKGKKKEKKEKGNKDAKKEEKTAEKNGVADGKPGKKKKSKLSKDLGLGRLSTEEEDLTSLMSEMEEEETSATNLSGGGPRESLKQPESFPSLIYNIEPENVAILANFWMTMEDRYLKGLRDALNQVRCHHDRLNKFMIEFRAQLTLFMNRPDRKQDLLTQFQERFNQVNSYIRGDFEVKAELHNRVTELRDRLSAICDERQEEASEEMHTVLSEGYLEGETEILTNLFVTFIQLEADHFCDVLQFINDFYSMTGLSRPETIPWCEILRIELISRSRYSANFFGTDENEGEGRKGYFDPNDVGRSGGKPQDLSSSLQAQQSQMSWNVSSSKSIAGKKGKLHTKQTKSATKRKKSVSSSKLLRKGSRAAKTFEAELAEGVPKQREDEQQGGDAEAEDDEEDEDARIRGYFGEDEEDLEIKIKKNYKLTIVRNYDQSVDFLESVMKRVMDNVEKIDTHTMNFLKTGTLKKDEPNTDAGKSKGTDESKSDHPKKKEKKEKKRRNTKDKEEKDKDSDVDSKTNEKEKKHKKRKSENSNEHRKSGQKEKENNESKDTIGSSNSNPKISPIIEPPKPKPKGTKRMAEWQSAVELEAIRVRQQLTLIHDKARRELLHLKEMLLQVILCAEKDTANTYKKEIDNVAIVCDIFRFAIENGTPVEAKLTLDQDKFEIGSQFRPDSSRPNSEFSHAISSSRGYEADNNYRSQSDNEDNTTDILD